MLLTPWPSLTWVSLAYGELELGLLLVELEDLEDARGFHGLACEHVAGGARDPLGVVGREVQGGALVLDDLWRVDRVHALELSRVQRRINYQPVTDPQALPGDA